MRTPEIVRRLVVAWWRSFPRNGIYVLGMYVYVHPILVEIRNSGAPGRGHPEKLAADQPLSPVERLIWAQLGDLDQRSKYHD